MERRDEGHGADLHNDPFLGGNEQLDSPKIKQTTAAHFLLVSLAEPLWDSAACGVVGLT